MTTITHRIAAATALLAAPALIALGTASTSHAESSVRTNGPTISHPMPRKAFPHQHVAAPGSREHHRHQWNHAG